MKIISFTVRKWITISEQKAFWQEAFLIAEFCVLQGTECILALGYALFVFTTVSMLFIFCANSSNYVINQTYGNQVQELTEARRSSTLTSIVSSVFVCFMMNIMHMICVRTPCSWHITWILNNFSTYTMKLEIWT